MSQPFRYRHLDRLVGAFMLGGVAILLGGVVLVGQARHWLRKPFPITIRFEQNSLGLLRPGLPVKVQGQEAGAVESSHVEGKDVYVRVLVHSEFQGTLRTDCRAVLRTPIAGFLGETFIEILPGNGEPLPDGKVVEFQPSEDLLEQARLTIIRFGEAAGQLRDLVQENRAEARAAVAGIRATADSLHATVDENRKGLQTAITRIEEMTREVSLLVAENRPAIKATGERLPGAVDALKTTIDKVGTGADRTGAAADEIGKGANAIGESAKTIGVMVDETRDPLKRTLADLSSLAARIDSLAADLQKVSAQVAAGKGSLGKLVMEDSAHDHAVKATQELTQRLEELEPIIKSIQETQLIMGLEGGGNTRSGSSTGMAYLRYEPRAWKFFQAGASYRTAPSDRTVIDDESADSLPVDFNLVLGWRYLPASDWSYYHLSLAGGVVESRLGGWAEIPLFTERLTLKLMLRQKHSNRVETERRYEEGAVMARAWIEARMWRRTFISAGYDDLAGLPGPWFGIRAELADNDIRNVASIAGLFK